MTHDRWVGLMIALYLVFVGIIAIRLWRERRAEILLHWPVAMTQRSIERYGTRFMTRHAWSVELATSIGGSSVYACIKHHDRLFILFLRDASSFQRMLTSLRREAGEAVGRLVVVLFDCPSPTMKRVAAESRVSVMHYRELHFIEERHQSLLPNVMAAREGAPASHRRTPPGQRLGSVG